MERGNIDNRKSKMKVAILIQTKKKKKENLNKGSSSGNRVGYTEIRDVLMVQCMRLLS